MEIKDLYSLYRKYPSIKIDTRKIVSGDIFFALKGPNFNGNHFAKQAIESGAAFAIVDEDLKTDDNRLIKTNDALATLQQLAKYHREQIHLPFIAITGSNGKTTTKELLNAVLSTTYKTYTTEGNLNNHIGVPLTLLKIKDDAEMAIVEMGANHKQEIEGYCKYTMPTHGLITNIGKAHLEGFGGIEGVKKGKGELFDYLRENNGTAFVNVDDNNVKDVSSGLKNILTYGIENTTINGKVINSKTTLEVEIDNKQIKTQLVGEYNLMNIIAAVAVGKYFKVPIDKIKSSIENYCPSNSRSQLIKKGNNTIILDAYNANPSSMKVAIENFANFSGEHKIVMLGAMLELGEDSKMEHQKLIDLLEKHDWHKVVLVGDNFKIDHKYIHLENADKATNWLKDQQFQNAQILIKGSRSMQMEKVLEAY